jgi:hypothetical protein
VGPKAFERSTELHCNDLIEECHSLETYEVHTGDIPRNWSGPQ